MLAFPVNTESVIEKNAVLVVVIVVIEEDDAGFVPSRWMQYWGSRVNTRAGRRICRALDMNGGHEMFLIDIKEGHSPQDRDELFLEVSEPERACWKTGMTVIPRAYRLKRKAQKLAALRKATAEYSHIQAQRKYHDIDSDTLVAGSRRQSAQMLDFDLDELA
ncbi:hypothetical protein R3P38DRAFT_2809049 [Favolaschia claudopus]|uniref:Uncharacterized protein n=1 Tax=Favolaschia claudopus TaxID=2862362 RepID=A0AAV9ZDS0_9AGAR